MCKSSPNIYQHFKAFAKSGTCYVKLMWILFGSFWRKLGYLLLKNLVTLCTTYNLIWTRNDNLTDCRFRCRSRERATTNSRRLSSRRSLARSRSRRSTPTRGLIKWGNNIAIVSILIERACSVEPVDKIKPVFIYCRFNISWIRKTVFENKNIFAYFQNAAA